MEGISVVISCYNSEKRIETTLEYLFNQKNPLQFKWEIILVDNNSKDNTAQVAKTYEQMNTFCKVPFRIVFEPLPGLNNARICGVANSKYDIVLFCDDDNWLYQDYVHRVFKTMQKDQQIGIVGGKGNAVFETKEPEWFQIHKHGYAVHSYGEGVVDLTETRHYVYGAGMAIRKRLFNEIVSNHKFITIDRKANKLTSGGDAEICLYAKLLGYRVIFNSNMQFYHFMPKSRLEWGYCRRLFNAFGESATQLFPYDFVLFEAEKSFNKAFFQFFLFHVKKLLASYKRLYFFYIKDLPGEEYITIYETSSRIIKTAFISYFKIYYHYKYLKNVFC